MKRYVLPCPDRAGKCRNHDILFDAETREAAFPYHPDIEGETVMTFLEGRPYSSCEFIHVALTDPDLDILRDCDWGTSRGEALIGNTARGPYVIYLVEPKP